LPSGCTARQPASIDIVQQSTSGGSMVIRIVPTLMSGALVMMSRSRTPSRALETLAINRSMTMLSSAANTGEKKRTPNWVSPQSDVPAN
jgi:hypothetical protein